MKKFNRVLSLILATVLTLGLITGALVTIASAATKYSLPELLAEGKIKPLGRTKVNAAGTGITADWSGNGFEINVDAEAGDFTVGYSSNQNGTYAAILVDGKQVWRGLATGTGSFKTTLTEGSHTVSVIRENGHSSSASQYFYLTDVTFTGTIGAKPADKSLYIEVVGDSYSCGSGSAAAYAPGVLWGDSDHSAQASFGWYLSKLLNADLSIVGRGGIGLFDGTSEQEGTANTVTMYDIYPYASGHNASQGAYDFARKPDLVVIELGANDTIDSGDQYKTIAAWGAKLAEMVELVREKNGADTKILLLSHNAEKYAQMVKIADADDKIWACHFSHHGNGSAAKTTQEEGHPSAADEYQIAEALYKSIQDNDILSTLSKTTPSYTDITYYVSENGSDDNDGKTLATAMKTLNTVFTKVIADNGDTHKFPAGTRVVIKVEGTVMTSPTATQLIGGSQVFLETGGTVRDHIPVLITTNDYSGTKATVQVNHAPVNNGNASTRVVNDLWFKDITLKSVTNTATGYCPHKLYASGCNLIFDNATVTTDGLATATGEDNTKWVISADHFNTGGFNPLNASFLPLYGSVTFRNGDYTDLNYVTAVNAKSISSSGTTVTALPQVNCSVIIEDGATMGTVYGVYGTMAVESATVELRGGKVNNYRATLSGTSSARLAYNTDLKTVFSGGTIGNAAFHGTGDYVDITGDVTVEFQKGQFIGQIFSATGRNVNITGNVTNNISGGEIRVNPESTTTGVDGIYLGGYNTAKITGNVTNNISGGDINLIYNANVDSGIYLGLRSGSITGDLTNNISGGNLCAVNGDASAKSKGIYLGMYGGSITGTLTNKITGGTLDGGGNFGNRTVHNYIGKIVNEIGIKDSDQGPRINSEVNLGGGWAYLGKNLGKVDVTAENNTDTVVMKTTIYSGSFSGAVFAGSAGAPKENTYWTYQIGSTQTDIYGGKFRGGFYGTGQSTVCGHVTTNIYGGYFTSIFGAYTAEVFDGVETNIYGMTEYYPCNPTGGYGIWAGGTSYVKNGVTYAAAVSAKTTGRPAAKVTIAPSVSDSLTLNTPIHAVAGGVSTITGDMTVSVSGGVYPNGFAVDGKSLGDVLASGTKVCKYPSGTQVTYDATDSAVSGNVIVLSGSQTASKSFVYYVRPNGDNANSGLSFSAAKASVTAAFVQAVADNGGSTVFPNGTKLTIYVDGTVSDSSGQPLLYGKLLTTEDGAHLETLVTTYPNSTAKATIVHTYAATASGAANAYLCTDLTLKNIDIMTKAPATGNYQTLKVLAAGCTLVFDNANLITNNAQKWIVSADHFSTGGLNPASGVEMTGTVIFRNGDYTNLNYVTTVNSGSIYVASGNTPNDIPNMHCKVIIEDGAKMSSVYGPVGAMKVGSSVVEVRGGSVANLYGTGSGTKDIQIDTKLLVTGGTVDTLRGTGNGANVKLTGDIIVDVQGGTVNNYYGTGTSVTVTGDINNTVSGGTVNNFFGTNESAQVTGTVNNTLSGGTVGGIRFASVGKTTTVTGNVVNTISGGKLELHPTHVGQENGIFFGGYTKAKITGNVTTTVTAGDVGVVYDEASADAGIYFGTHSSGDIGGNVTNNISGGNFYTKAGKTSTIGYAGIHFGMFTGRIGGDLVNNISGGTFSVAKNAFYMGHRGVSSSSNRIINVIGQEGSTQGPAFADNVWINLGGGWGRLGNTTNVATMPTENSDTVVISSTIYGGTFAGPVSAGVSSAYTSNTVYVKGGIQNKIYGGTFSTFYCSGNAPVFGHVSTDIYGGTFNSIYGGRSGSIRDGAQLNIYAMTEGSEPTGIWAGAGAGDISVTTAGRDALKLTIAPESADKLVLSMPITLGASGAGTITGTVTATVSGGTYTRGFEIKGKTLEEVLAQGCYCLDQSGKVMALTSGQTATTGYTVVGKADLSTAGAEVKLSETSYIYDGNEKKPTVAVTLGGKQLTQDTDYTVSYLRNGTATSDVTSMGTVTVVITGKGDLSGTISAAYEIIRDPAVAAAIAAVTERINGYDVATVTSAQKADITADKQTVAEILQQHGPVLTEDEKTALDALSAACDTRLAKVQAVADEMAAAQALVKDLTADNVTSDNKADVESAKAKAQTLLAGTNLTADERTAMTALVSKCDALLAKVQTVADEIAAAQALVKDLAVANVTADDKADVESAKAKTRTLLNGTNLTADERTALTALVSKCDELLTRIQTVADAVADVEAALKDLTEDNVTSDNKAAVTDAKESAAELLSGSNLTDAQRTAMTAAKAKAEKLLAKIQSVADAMQEAIDLIDGLSPSNITSADREKLTRSKALADGLLAGNNLTAAEQETMQTGSDSLAQSLQLLDAIAAKQKAVTDALRTLTEDNVKSTNKETVEAALADAEALLASNNLATEERATMTAAKTEADTLLAKIKAVSDEMEAAQALVDGLTEDNVTEADRTDVEAALAKAEALLDTPANLTAEEKAAMEELVETCDALIARLNTMLGVDEKLDTAKKLLDALEVDTVTSDDKKDLDTAKALLDAVAAEEKLTNEQKKLLDELTRKHDGLLQRIEDVAALADPGEVGEITEETVELDDEDALREKLEILEEVLRKYSDNYTDEEQKAVEDTIDQIEDALKVIEDVQEAEEELLALPETAQPDDEKAVEAAEKARKAYDGLTDRGRELLSEEAVKRLEDLEKALTDYKFTEGAGSTWKEAEGGDLEFTANGLLRKHTGVLVDGVAVPTDGYTAVSGSTVVTLKESYLATLSAGEHNLTVVYTDGFAVCQFTVKTKTTTPPTGDGMEPGMLFGMLALSALGIVALVPMTRRKRR